MKNESPSGEINNGINHALEVNPISKAGALLKEERIKQNLSTAFLASSLHMGEEQLIALEEGQESLLPEKVFVQAMVRRVGERLKIDPSLLSIERVEPQTKNENIYNNFSEKLREKIQSNRNIFIFFASVLLIGIAAKYINSNQNNINIPGNHDELLSNISEHSTKITISSISPSKAKIMNGLGDILHEGLIKSHLTFSIQEGLKIYAYRPDLIEIKREGDIATILSSFDDLRWHDLSEKNGN